MPSSDATYRYSEFLERFPDNDACLDYLRDKFFPEGTPCPKCEKPSKFHRITGRSAYSCQRCGFHVYPTAGTIFHKTTVNLQLWFYAIYLMASTRCGISAKQLEREIGVSNKTALRMFRQIRSLLHEDDQKLVGPLEADETYVGGKRKGMGMVGRPGLDDPKKTPVFAMVERGGRVVARVVPDTTALTLMPIVKQYVLPGSMVYTDEYGSYNDLKLGGYQHRRVHHRQKIYVAADGASTNAAEGFFALAKNGIRGVYHSVSRQHLQSYLDEYSFRYNRRGEAKPMFWAILDRVQKTPALPAS
jgi:transposase-like protein